MVHVLITLSSNRDSGEPALMHSLVRAFSSLIKIDKNIYQTLESSTHTACVVPLECTSYHFNMNMTCAVNSKIFARTLFSLKAFKDIFATFKICDQGMIYFYQ